MDDPDRSTPRDDAQVQISASEEDLKGRYGNLMSVSHTAEEFVLDFFSVTPTPNGPRGHLISRVIVSPSHFRRIVGALGDNLRKYEEQFGEIDEAPDAVAGVEDPGFMH